MFIYCIGVGRKTANTDDGEAKWACGFPFCDTFFLLVGFAALMPFKTTSPSRRSTFTFSLFFLIKINEQLNHGHEKWKQESWNSWIARHETATNFNFYCEPKVVNDFRLIWITNKSCHNFLTTQMHCLHVFLWPQVDGSLRISYADFFIQFKFLIVTNLQEIWRRIKVTKKLTHENVTSLLVFLFKNFPQKRAD